MEPEEQADTYTYNIIMITRRVELVTSCAALLFIIISIITRKIYVYNTIRLFMFVCIFYLIGMLVVALHIPQYFTYGCKQFTKTKANQIDLDQPLIWNHQHNNTEICSHSYFFEQQTDSTKILCGMQAFINIFCYHLAYVFAVLISYNVYCVIKNKHQQFMRVMFTNKWVIIFLILILIADLFPFVFMFIKEIEASYGPVGFKFNEDYFILFCGMAQKCDQANYKYYLLFGFCYLLTPLCLFFIHALILWRIRFRIKKYLDLEYLNSKQQFVVRSGRIGFVVFIFQAINLFKEIITSIGFDALKWPVFVLNFFFDLYPWFLLGSFLLYTRRYRRFNNQTLMTQQ